MRAYQKFIALMAALSIIAFSIIIFLQSIVDISVRKNKYHFKSTLVKNEIDVYRNQYGIPLINAQNEDDMFFATGYVQAEDRMWQMDYLRRSGMGRLSEIFGEKMYGYDKFIRTIGLDEISKRIYSSLSSESKKILINYSNGVNEYLRVNKNRLSFEFGALDYTPEKWQPYQSILILRLISFEMSQGFRTETVFAEIAGKIGYQKAQKLIPNYKTQKIVFENKNNISTSQNQINEAQRSFKLQAELFGNFSDQYFSALNILGIKTGSTGSNIWVYSGGNDTNKKSIISCDPHFSLGIPAKFYEIQMSCPGIELAGAAFPGFPLVVIGRNKCVAWGFANAMIDDCDLFAEEIDSTGNNFKNQSTGKFEKIKYRTDTIKIKNKPPRAFYIRSTGKSNLMDDFSNVNPDNKSNSANSSEINPNHSLSLSFNWIGNEISDETDYLYQLSKASSVRELSRFSSKWKSPDLVLLAVDKNGEMLKTVIGSAPLRKKGCTPFFPNKTSSFESDWFGVKNLSEEYFELSKTEKYFISANNKLSESESFPGFWNSDSRFTRINNLLKVVNNYTVRDAQIMQNDIVSDYSQNFLKITLPVLEKYSHLLTDKNEKICYEKLKSWDYLMSVSSIGASVYNAFIERIVYNTFHDELGDDLYNGYTFTESLPLIKILEELENNSDYDFFDNVSTSEKENKEFIIFQSFKDAVANLKHRFNGDKPDHWQYGKIHQLNLKHALSDKKLFKPGITIEHIPLSGNNTTINNNEWKFSAPFDVQVGASLRFISQIGDSVVYLSIPGGESGDEMNPNFNDQLQIWANGGYFKLPLSNKNEKKSELRIVIKPD